MQFFSWLLQNADTVLKYKLYLFLVQEICKFLLERGVEEVVVGRFEDEKVG